jgi:predicted nucleic acid-binding protein
VKYLLDTCVLSELVKPKPQDSVLHWMRTRQAQHLYTSAITLAELQRGVQRLPLSRRRDALSQWLVQLDTSFEDRILSFDRETAGYWAALCSQAEQNGHTMAAYDSLIAATAMAHGLALVTRNIKDFAAAPLVLINPWASESTNDPV